MSKTVQKERPVAVDRHSHKASAQARVAVGTRVANSAPKSPVYQTNPVIKQAADNVAAAAEDIRTADSSVVQLEQLLTAARAARDAKCVGFDGHFDLLASCIEVHVPNQEGATALGASIAKRSKHPLLPPLGLVAIHDAHRGRIDVHVHPSLGCNRVALEISPEPATDKSYAKLPGYGCRRSLANYGPGTYWLRAASMRKDQQSEYTAPVSVVVK